MLPSFAVVAWGVNATDALVISQVVLSLALPVPMVALLVLSGRRDIMGAFVTTPVTRTAMTVAAVVVLALNLILVAQLLGLPIPFIGG